MKRFHRWAVGALLVLIGLILAVAGGWLIALGGSFYYLAAGLGCVVSGALIIHNRVAGVWVYTAVAAGTVLWALWEVGIDFWQLLPRVGGPLVILFYIVTPWFRHSFEGSEQEFAKAPRRLRTSSIAVAAGGIVLLAAVSFIALQPTHSTADSRGTYPAEATPDWVDYAGDKAGTRFSPATQITPANVSDLKIAWTFRTGDLPENYPNSRAPQMFEATPLQVGNTLFICTPRDIIIALDADTGEERWRHDPKIDDTGVYTMTCRGLAYHQSAPSSGADCPGRLLVATVDGRMIAVNAQTGRRCRNFGRNGQISLRDGMGSIEPGFHFNTSPPAIVGDAAIVGGFVLDNMASDAPSGVVRAFNVIDGRPLWSWDAGRKDPNAPLGRGETHMRGSPNAWSLFSADEKLGLVYVPTGNPSPDYFGGQRSPEMERYGSSVVALNATSGKMQWAFQTVHHDLWDYDVGSQPVLADLTIGENQVPALIQATKQGEIFLLDRRTGQPLLPVEERPVPRGNVPGERYSATQPVSRALPSLVPPALREQDMWGATPLDQLWCRISFRQLRYSGRFTPPSLDNSLIFPGNNGIMNWGSVAIDTERQILVVPTSYMAMTLKLIPRDQAPATDQIVLDGRAAISPMLGTPYAVRTERPFQSPLGLPCNAPPWGRLTAIDLKSRKVLWQRPLGTTADHAPLRISVPGVFNQGGAMVTRSGVVFIGATLDNYLRAFDLTSGKELWKGRLPAGGQALPMSYVSPQSGKQYVVIAAGGHQFMDTTIGDHVVAYSLPE
ncbi:membrane-bound PQQ-dependent dehydrogenase, glucose/quinate/shikimate family [Croceicoccus sp. F390]|uniref:Membrane-bound PQQ-dependent dehydrogenase, glucose/quinate/shikimate family n=1 Tax=Croceicoccus esteveae TaxID=3075597 RepID=A0ABU2ZL67_9SPHN|nr:membrane-bound PQQ-dependent dehydrogenase, glucose/quinate/shikimate family [Croceicoccus sp. F390]MDT0577125.1 membrane-bound PQQ-dependent dehydrogenase, glucose/quinate/shikimate family [Croceicoccus sp. F390]